MLTYKQKIFIDRTFGTVAVVFVRYLTRLVGLILRRDHTLPSAPKAIVVAKIVGLGSIVYTGILCRALKERFPGTRLLYLTSSSSASLVERMNFVDERVVIKERGIASFVASAVRAVLTLWRRRPSLYFDMEVYSSLAAILATLSLALNRYGFYRKSVYFKKELHTHAIFFNTRRHITDIYSQMALAVGGIPRCDIEGILIVTAADREQCAEMLQRIGAGEAPLILVNINTSELLIERRWPAAKWAEYLTLAVRRFPEYRFVLTGSPTEANYVSSLNRFLPGWIHEKILNVAGKTSFGAYLALIERCAILVTNDSGPLHFANALGKPTVSIWGPGAPEHYAPLVGVHKIVYRPSYCSPCLYHADISPCGGRNICVSEILVSTVLETTAEVLLETRDTTQQGRER